METRLKQILATDGKTKKTGLNMESIIASLKEFFPETEIKKHIAQVIREKDGYIMKASKKEKGTGRVLYKLRPVRGITGRNSKQRPDTDATDTTIIGKAGEMAVISELLYNGYTANTMIVDKGIDIVASKDNKFYYIQVKTTYLDEDGKCSISIPLASYQRVENLGNVAYIIVIRSSIGHNLFFVFTQRDIDLAIKNGDVDQSDTNVNIKIRFDSIDKLPYLYNGRYVKCIKAYLNNFKLSY